MNYREAQLLYPQMMTAGAGTVVIDVDVNKPITRICITFKTKKVLHYMTDPGPMNIPKIELVDGSTVLHALTGFENQALAYYSRPKANMEQGEHLSGETEINHYAIDFGRFKWDELLAFDPLRFHNPQLKITYNQAVSDTSAIVNELTVWAEIFDEKVINPIGFLMAVEHYAYTPGAQHGYEMISLPSDRPIRQMLVRAHREQYEPWNVIYAARLDEGTLDTIPWEYPDLEDYSERNKDDWPEIETHFNVALAGEEARVFYIPQTNYYAHVVGEGLGNTAIEFRETLLSSAGGYCSLQGTLGGQLAGHTFGYLPWHCYQFPFGKKDVIEDWYDPTGKKPRLRLRTGAGEDNGDVQVVLEELYKY